MIAEGLFKTQLDRIAKLLDELSLLEDRAYSPNKTLGAAHFRGMSYREMYEECVKEYAYDFRLVDHSLLLFVKRGTNQHNGGLSFSYKDSPFRAMTYKEFVGSHFNLTVFDEQFEIVVAEWGEELRSDYEQYMNTMDAQILVTPVRYDYHPPGYRAGVHPVSHMHFGFENDIRIPTQRIMNPISFTLLIIRQRYPRYWEILLDRRDADLLCRNVREALSEVHDDYKSESDLKALSLQ